MQVFCDFDGTISVQDATDFILTRFADPKWEQIEEEWRRGTIGSAQCMQRQVALIRASREQLNAALDEIEIDPSFPAFIRFCHAQKITVTVVSDGVDYFIDRIFARHRLPPLPVIANQLKISGLNGQTHYHLISPFSEVTCASAAGVCKCRSVSGFDGTGVYVGDGRSDFCVANKPDLIFAKGKLAKFCERRDIAFIPYRQFADIEEALKTILPISLHRPPVILTRAFVET
jgi:2-hydroxy-3-keto-5-methylthiopentenyl-1-phosphate phosphatase